MTSADRNGRGDSLRLFRTVFAVPLRDRGVRGSAWERCSRGNSADVRLFLSRDALNQLHGPRTERMRWTGPPIALDWSGAVAFDFEFARAGDGTDTAVLSFVLDAPGGDHRPTLGEALAAIDTARLLEPWWPGQKLRRWYVGDTPFDGLRGVLGALVWDFEPIFEDPRAFTLTLAKVEALPPRAELYAVAAVDPPDLPPLPVSDLDAFFAHASYLRWLDAGTYWGFTHYSGACVTTTVADWIDRLFLNQYRDLIHHVVTLGALRHLRAGARSATLPPVLASWSSLEEKTAHWERTRLSEQDQGRWLARLWLDRIEADRGDAEHWRSGRR